MGRERRLEISLLLLRLGVFVVMFFWTLDKFVAPEHAPTVFQHFYHLEGLGSGALAHARRPRGAVPASEV